MIFVSILSCEALTCNKVHLAFAFGLLLLAVATINVVVLTFVLYITVYNEPAGTRAAIKSNIHCFIRLITCKAQERSGITGDCDICGSGNIPDQFLGDFLIYIFIMR